MFGVGFDYFGDFDEYEGGYGTAEGGYEDLWRDGEGEAVCALEPRWNVCADLVRVPIQAAQSAEPLAAPQ